MDHVEITLNYSPVEAEVAIGLLSQFEQILSMQQVNDHLLVYIQEDHFNSIKNDFKTLIDSFNWSSEEKIIPYKNWNEEWEKNFNPIAINDLCLVRADFHVPDYNYKHEIILNPKNAFGTGHHETTFIMMQSMPRLDWKNKRCLDFGTGTGILSIWSHILGCRDITAIDNTAESIENTKDNLAQNGIAEAYPLLLGSLEIVDNQSFDIILANINRNVLLEYADQLITKLTHKGHLLLSGILKEDERMIRAAYSHLLLMDVSFKGEWCLFHYLKP